MSHSSIAIIREHISCAVSNPIVKDPTSSIKESKLPDLPLNGVRSIFPFVKALNSNKLTGNYTFYTKEALVGDKVSTGYRTFVNPFGRPVIREHMLSAQMGLLGSGPLPDVPMGRIVMSGYQERKGPHLKPKNKLIPGFVEGDGSLNVVMAVTDQVAIERLLGRIYHTVSIGARAGAVIDSITGKNLLEKNEDEDTEVRNRGQVYGGKLCYWMYDKLAGKEISFVNSPSDEHAHVVSPDIGLEGIQLLLGEKKFATKEYCLYDVLTKKQVLFEDHQTMELDPTFIPDSVVVGQDLYWINKESNFNKYNGDDDRSNDDDSPHMLICEHHQQSEEKDNNSNGNKTGWRLRLAVPDQGKTSEKIIMSNLELIKQASDELRNAVDPNTAKLVAQKLHDIMAKLNEEDTRSEMVQDLLQSNVVEHYQISKLDETAPIEEATVLFKEYQDQAVDVFGAWDENAALLSLLILESNGLQLEKITPPPTTPREAWERRASLNEDELNRFGIFNSKFVAPILTQEGEPLFLLNGEHLTKDSMISHLPSYLTQEELETATNYIEGLVSETDKGASPLTLSTEVVEARNSSNKAECISLSSLAGLMRKGHVSINPTGIEQISALQESYGLFGTKVLISWIVQEADKLVHQFDKNRVAEGENGGDETPPDTGVVEQGDLNPPSITKEGNKTDKDIDGDTSTLRVSEFRIKPSPTTQINDRKTKGTRRIVLK